MVASPEYLAGMLEPSGELCGSRSLSKTCDRVVVHLLCPCPVVAIFSTFPNACSREVPVAAHHLLNAPLAAPRSRFQRSNQIS